MEIPKLTTFVVSLLTIATLSGCAQSPQLHSNTVNSKTSNNIIPGNTSNTGSQIWSVPPPSKSALLKDEENDESKAKQEANNYQAQIDAGVGCHMAGNDVQAIAYYKKAIQINPGLAEAYNNIGNIYFHFKHKPQVAIPYYEKATKVQPGYGYGWLNLATAEKQVGNISRARSAVQNGLKMVSKSSSVYQMLKTYETRLVSS